MGKFEDLSGRKFEKLKVIKRVENSKGGATRWLCECECGKEKIAYASDLKSGHTKSCGCHKIKCLLNSVNFHGKRHTRLYTTWSNMKQRCYNQNSERYKDYGGRGITVCEEWIHDFMSFYIWAIQNGYAENFTLDRKDNDKGYSPDNCRWATYKEQANNKRNNVLITYKGEIKTLSQWADELKMEYDTLYARIFIQELDVENAFNETLKKG